MAYKISERVEFIFSTSVGLNQSGRFKSVIFCTENDIFIKNIENTLILKFGLKPGENPFDKSVSFNSSDYDSREFEEKDGRVYFITKKSKLIKRQSCATSESPKKIELIYKKLYNKFESLFDIEWNKDVLELLDLNLSHVEIKSNSEGIKLLQRNIYDGTLIEIEKVYGLLSSQSKKNLPDMAIGIRTADFRSLFEFQDSINIKVGIDYSLVEGMSKWIAFSGIMSNCKYDELGELKIIK